MNVGASDIVTLVSAQPLSPIPKKRKVTVPIGERHTEVAPVPANMQIPLVNLMVPPLQMVPDYTYQLSRASLFSFFL